MRFLFLLIMLFMYSLAYAGDCGETDEYGWQQVDSGYTYRMPVPGGWLTTYKIGYGATNVFIPDTDHKWELKCP